MVAIMGWGMNILEQSWRKGPWTPEEDKLLSEYVTLNGEGRWSSVSRSAGLNRSGKSCRLRWVNYLRPGLKRGHITPQEEGIIIELHALWGNKWATIARYLPGRTDNEIKNFWRTRFKKKDKSSHQKRMLQKKRSQALKEKFQMDRLLIQAKEESAKTTAIDQKTTLISTSYTTTTTGSDHQEAPAEPEIINNQDNYYNENNMIFTDPTTLDNNNHHHQNNIDPVMMCQDGSTALFPWSDATGDNDYGLWGVLWNSMDDNVFGYGRTD